MKIKLRFKLPERLYNKERLVAVRPCNRASGPDIAGHLVYGLILDGNPHP